jgi:hypothetical protein
MNTALHRLVLGALLLAVCTAAHALHFQAEKDPKSGLTSLWIEDRCSGTEADERATDCHFREGDAGRLREALAQNIIYQVKLSSAGGAVTEGLAIGRILRQKNLKVTVPAGAKCASSCTIAFMGGVIRSVSPSAKFEVHSPSVLLHGVSPEARTALFEAPEKELKGFAQDFYDSGKEGVVDLIVYFQEMIKGAPNETALRVAVENGPREPTYFTADQLQKSAMRIRTGGDAGLQSVLMELERAGVAQALENIKPSIPDLGSRAEPAIKLVKTMYTSSIIGVFDLEGQTLHELGYTNASEE